MQRVFDRLAHRLVDAVGHQAVEAGAFVDFVEMDDRLAFEQHPLAVAALDRRTVGVVQHAFDQVAGRQQVLQALLILNADQVAAEIVGDAHGGDVHFALGENLLVGQIGLLVRAGDELHALVFHPLADGPGFVVGDLRGFVVQGRLAEAFLEHAHRVEQFVLDDGVVHAHAAFVEDAHDRPLLAELFGQGLAELALRPTGTLIFFSGVTCLSECLTSPLSSHLFRFLTKKSSVKSSLQRVENFLPALVKPALRFNMPTNPGQVPDQLATVKIGPLWASKPGSTWCEYCHTASATMILALGSMPAKTSSPSFCEPMKPCFSSSL